MKGAATPPATNVARDLSKTTKQQLMATLAETVPETVTHMVDLGCGTGRFTAALADAFACAVTGVEPSGSMLEIAQHTLSDNARITLKEGSAEKIPLPDSCASLVFMSQVYHHLSQPEHAVAEVSRVLGPGGYFAIRNATLETHDSANLPWLRFFPEAEQLEKARIPTRDQLIKTVTQTGFKLVENTTIRQEFARSPDEYAAKIGQRGLSALVLLSDEAFAAGLERLRAWADEQPDTPIYQPIDLFIFQK